MVKQDTKTIFRECASIMAAFKILFLMCTIIFARGEYGFEKTLMRQFLYFSNWAFFIMIFSLCFPEKDYLTGVALSTVLLACFGYWCLILPGFVIGQSQNGAKERWKATRWIPESLLTHFVSLIAGLVAWSIGYTKIDKDEVPLGGWAPFITGVGILLFQMIIQVIFAKIFKSDTKMYPSKAVDIKNPVSYINLFVGVGLTALCYWFLLTER